MWILVHLYHHHHYQQSSFLITFNTANPHLKIKPCSNTWKPILRMNSACACSNLWSLFLNFQGSRILLLIWPCLGALDLLKLLKQQPCRVPLSVLQNGVVLCWKLWPFLQRVLNSPTARSALVSPHMEAHWHHWSTRWILRNIKVWRGRRLCHFLDLIIWHNLHHLAHLSPYPTEWVGAWPFQVVHFCPLQWCDSPKSFLLLWSQTSSLTKICSSNYHLDVPYPCCIWT